VLMVTMRLQLLDSIATSLPCLASSLSHW